MSRTQIFSALLSLVLLTFGVACSEHIYYNNAGVLAAKTQGFDEARTYFLDSLVEEPNLLAARYNLSMADLSLEKLNESLKEIEYLEEKVLNSNFKNEKIKKDLLFKIYFAHAFLNGLIEKTPEALEFYQKCLEIEPNSKRVKKNIELLVSNQGKGGKSGKKGKEKKKSKGKGEGDSDQKEKGEKKDESDEATEGEKQKKAEGGSLKKKNLSKKEIEQILKEIKKQESKVRAKEGKKTKGKSGSGKSW